MQKLGYYAEIFCTYKINDKLISNSISQDKLSLSIIKLKPIKIAKFTRKWKISRISKQENVKTNIQK